MNKQQFLGVSLHTGLMGTFKESTVSLIGMDVDRNTCIDCNVMVKHFSTIHYCAFDEFTPISRPLSDLTKPITHNGETFVPMYRLLKTQGFSVNNIQNWTFEFHKENNVASATNGDWMLRYMGNDESFFLNGLQDWNRKHQKSRKQLEMFMLIIEWHFSLMDSTEPFIPVTSEFNPYK